MTIIKCYQNEEVKEVRALLDDWAIRAYKGYPYFYMYDDETDYNTMFEVDPTAFVLIAEQDGKKIAHLSANAMDSPLLASTNYTPIDALEEIEEKGFDLSQILYISCFLMDDRQNKELANQLFQAAVKKAKAAGKTYICYMAMVEMKNHPLQPEPYYPIEPWNLLDVSFERMGIEVTISWPTLMHSGDIEEMNHRLELFILKI